MLLYEKDNTAIFCVRIRDRLRHSIPRTQWTSCIGFPTARSLAPNCRKWQWRFTGVRWLQNAFRKPMHSRWVTKQTLGPYFSDSPRFNTNLAFAAPYLPPNSLFRNQSQDFFGRGGFIPITACPLSGRERHAGILLLSYSMGQYSVPISFLPPPEQGTLRTEMGVYKGLWPDRD